MIAQASKIEEDILDIKYGRVQQGLKIGIKEIDEFIQYKQGNFNVVIGHSNVGKTTIILYFFTLWAIKHNLRFLVWSSENTSQSLFRKIIEFKMNKPIEVASDKEINKAISWCDLYFKIIDVEELFNYEQLLKQANQIKDAWNYHGFLIDPYNSLRKEVGLLKMVGSHEYDYEVASKFRLFTKKRNVTIFLNCHGVTEALRKVHPKGHEYESLPTPLAMSSVEGGGKWGNRSDDMWSVHRYTSHGQEWMFSHLSVLKVKENETGGRCTPFEEPIKLRMTRNNTGFSFMGRDLIHEQPIKTKISL